MGEVTVAALQARPVFPDRDATVELGAAPAQGFANRLSHLTVDSGKANPGCAAVQYNSSNQGMISQVTIISGDGRGVIGLDMGYTNEVGPQLVKDVLVQGFDTGIRAVHPFDPDWRLPVYVANFILIHFPTTKGKTSADADAFLTERGLVLRALNNYGLPQALRMTIGTEEANMLVRDGLRDFMAQP